MSPRLARSRSHFEERLREDDPVAQALYRLNDIELYRLRINSYIAAGNVLTILQQEQGLRVSVERRNSGARSSRGKLKKSPMQGHVI